jgi:hypothetical protein
MRFYLLAVFVSVNVAVSAQAPGTGWATVPTPERVVKTLYWQVFNETEVWTRVVPTGPSRQPIPVSMIVSVVLPGKLTLPLRRPQTPSQIMLLAQPSPLAVLPSTSATFQLTTDDGRELNLLGAAKVFAACDGCSSQAIQVLLDTASFAEIASSGSIRCDVLGLTGQLSLSDTDAIRAVGRAVGLF